MKTMSRKLAIPLLGILLWVLSMHAGTFATASLSSYTTGYNPENANHVIPEIVQITGKDLNNSVTFGHNVINRMLRLETNLGWSNVHVKKGTPSHGQLIVSKPEREALEQGRKALVAAKATIHLMNAFCHRLNLSPSNCMKYITSHKFSSTPLEASCQKIHKLCSMEEMLSPYRSIDGTCNHKSFGSQGASFTAYRRLLNALYLDGVQEPRRSVTKSALPSARLVSSLLVKDGRNEDSDWTLVLPEWSQFIEHDLSHTATSKMVHSDNTIECCASSGSNLSPRYIHPFCAPISIPIDDQYYSKHGLDCMTYVRSVPAFRSDCSFGPVEQINQATHFLDGSQIYGSSIRKELLLRSFKNGELKLTKKNNNEYLPKSLKPNDDCQVNDENSICFLAGDSRVNVIPQLTVMHTLWLREHNRISRELSKLNPSWIDEVLFQEARKIVISELQHITYNEWLPQILGKKYYNKMGKYRKYDERVSPSVSNSFATAAVRVWNSLMDGKVKLYTEDRQVNSTINLRNYFNNPGIIEQPGYLDALIRGLSTQSSQQLDTQFTEDVSSQLFSNGAYGYDIFSLDIQRGRDHGLPPYNSFRQLCGLKEAKIFNDLLDTMSPETVKSLSKVYASPRDIDLIVGAVSEQSTGGSLFGPTLSCIFLDQFLRTRRGDRYFYTNEFQPAPLSEGQMKEIKKVTLARVFCDNGDDIKRMQLNVFKKLSKSNKLVDCSSIPQMNLSPW